MTMNKVLVLRGDSYKAVGELFASLGCEVVYDSSLLSEVNLVVFTGGSDVSPYIYGEEPAGARGCDPRRDEIELSIWNGAKSLNLPCVGICRGGQLLNVLNGGSMIQDIKPMLSGDVTMIIPEDAESYDTLEVRVDHHQGMIPDETDHDVLWISHPSGHRVPRGIPLPWYEIFYPDTKDLCVQYHPEWGHEGTKQRFISLLKRFLDV